MSLDDLIKRLESRQKLFYNIAQRGPGFAQGFANGLQEAIDALKEELKTAGADLEDMQPVSIHAPREESD